MWLAKTNYLMLFGAFAGFTAGVFLVTKSLDAIEEFKQYRDGIDQYRRTIEEVPNDRN